MGRIAAVGLLLFCTAISGCLIDDLFTGECNPSPWTVQWTEPDLLHRLPDDGPHGPYVVATDLILGNVTLTEPRLDAWWGAHNYSFQDLSWSVVEASGRFGATSIQFNATGVARTTMGEETPVETIRTDFVAFARNVTLADDADIQAAADAFVASRSYGGTMYRGDPDDPRAADHSLDFYDYEVDLVGPWRLGTLFGDVVPDVEDAVRNDLARVQVPHWTFHFDLLERTANATLDGSHVVLTADLFDGARFAVQADRQPPQEEMRGLLSQTFVALDLGEPAIVEPTFSSKIRC